MPDVQHLLLFMAAGWLLNLTPGPDVFYIVSHSLRSGTCAGIVAGLGITAGCFVHICAAALGISALLTTSAFAFTVLKYIGAAYLVWAGIKTLMTKAPQGVPAAITVAQPSGLKSIFAGGFLTNVLNPKVAIFFLAFVPQFIAPDTSNKAFAFAVLGIIFNLNAVPVNAGWALAAAWMARGSALRLSMRWLDRVAACMFIGFGLRLALTDSPAR